MVLLGHLVGGCGSNNAAASGDIVSWKVRNEQLVLDLSSSEAEYLAISLWACKLLW